MAVIENNYTGNGSTVLYSFTFPYIDEADIKVKLNGTLTTAYTLANATTIQFNSAPTNGTAIRIYRETEDSALQSTFYAGSAIRAQDLNDNFNQNLYISQETKGRNVDPYNPSVVADLNLNGNRITNLASPTASTDAATKEYTDNVILGQIPDGTLTNVKVSPTAAISGTKINPNFGSQNVSTTGSVSGAALGATGAITGASLTTTGNAGIGTTLPNALYRQTINGDGSTVIGGLSLKSQSTDTLFIGNIGVANNVDSEIWNPRNGYLRFGTNNFERVRIDSSGRVGIGTTSPSSPLHVNGDVTLSSLNSGQLAGMRNRLINGGMAIDQRNAGAAQTITAGAALAYSVDRWYAYCTGANVTGQQVQGASAGQFRYRFTGAASVTGVGFGQRIEQLNSADLAGTTATLSVDLANSVLTTVTWTAYYANTADTFGTLASPTRTLIATGTFTVSSTVTRYSANINIPAAATTGIEIVLSVGAQTSGTWTIGNVQLEAGTVATPFERRSHGLELTLCKRYFEPRYFGHRNDNSNTGAAQFSIQDRYSVEMRVTPTAANLNTAGSTNFTSITYDPFDKTTAFINGFKGVSSPTASIMSGTVTLSAEL